MNEFQLEENSMRSFQAIGLLFLFLTLPQLNGQDTPPQVSEPKLGKVQGVPVKDPYFGCLIVRQGPGMDTAVLGNVKNGDEVTIGEMEGNWLKITTPLKGYVWSSYIIVTESRPPAPGKGKPPLSIEEYFFNSTVSEKAKDIKNPEDAGKNFFAAPNFDLIKWLNQKYPGKWPTPP